MSSETAISRWLQDKMPNRGYPLGGHKAGGISRLAEDAGIPQATMSRLVNGGGGEPSVGNLRKIGQVFGYTLGEMMVVAGLAEPEEIRALQIPAPGAGGVDLPPELDLRALPEHERHIWLTPGLSVDDRRALVLFVRLRRGELTDPQLILTLYRALGDILPRHLLGTNGNSY